jgi:hypothetical protein
LSEVTTVTRRAVVEISDHCDAANFIPQALPAGHSFKPILEFTLSLFGAQFFITAVLRQMSPSLGKMVAKAGRCRLPVS